MDSCRILAFIPHIASVRGMVQRLRPPTSIPRFELYVSPVNVDPEGPSLPISAPARFSRDIAAEIGRYPTLGIPEDTSALRQGVINLDQFIVASRLVLADERRLLRESLHRFAGGFLFFYFSSIDQNSHILWGQHDLGVIVFEFYRAIDDSIGEVVQKAPSAELMVMSDHGFAGFRARRQHEQLAPRPELLAWKPGTQDIDLSRTKAYALGLNALYVVPYGPKRAAVIGQLRQQLLALRDPQNDAQVVEVLADTNAPSPALIVGYARGYRRPLANRRRRCIQLRPRKQQ